MPGLGEPDDGVDRLSPDAQLAEPHFACRQFPGEASDGLGHRLRRNDRSYVTRADAIALMHADLANSDRKFRGYDSGIADHKAFTAQIEQPADKNVSQHGGKPDHTGDVYPTDHRLAAAARFVRQRIGNSAKFETAHHTLAARRMTRAGT